MLVLSDEFKGFLLTEAENLSLISEQLNQYLSWMTEGTNHYCSVLAAVMHIEQAVEEMEKL